MRDEYDIKNLNPRKNPYAARLISARYATSFERGLYYGKHV